MEGVIRLDAGGMDRKYFYAFFKGLVQIKYKEHLLKSKEMEVDESMDLQFLYSNLFNDQETSLECMLQVPFDTYFFTSRYQSFFCSYLIDTSTFAFNLHSNDACYRI